MMIDRSLNYGRHIIKRFFQQAGPASQILDIGAGTGIDLKIAQEVNPNAHIYGIECHPPYIQELNKMGFGIKNINIERDPFPFNNESFDVVMANQILEHVKEIFWIIHEISRILNIGGHLIIGVPNLASFHNRVLLALGCHPTSIKVPSAHVRGFTKGGILNFFNEACPGLYSLVQFRGSNFYPFPPFLATPLSRLMPGMAVGSFYLLKKTRSYKDEILEFVAPGRMETNYFTGC